MCGGMAYWNTFGASAVVVEFSAYLSPIYLIDTLGLLLQWIHLLFLQVYRKEPFGHHCCLTSIFACFQEYQNIA